MGHRVTVELGDRGPGYVDPFQQWVPDEPGERMPEELRKQYPCAICGAVPFFPEGRHRLSVGHDATVHEQWAEYCRDVSGGTTSKQPLSAPTEHGEF